MDFAAFLDQLRRSPHYRGQLAHVHRIPRREARFAEPRQPLSPAGRRLLDGLGIRRLYTHQAEALDAVRDGHDLLVTTGTGSGKTLCYLLPVLERLEEDPAARVLAIYPTKALAQDQLRVLQRARGLAGVNALAGTYDGDTPASRRRHLRDEAAVILTNPDMLHASVLPAHPRWAAVFRRLAFVVVDELHVYTGLLGANAANLFRRLDRLFRHYGCRPQFLASSATLANPAEVAAQVLGRPVRWIAEDGSPRGERTFVLWNPPRERPGRWRSRRSANVEAQELMTALVRAGAPTITFSKAKVTAELIYRYVREGLERDAPALAAKVTPYRGGYLPAERRAIEKKLFAGELLGVSSTPALELGIDVGGLEASILVGYPGTLASFFQQAGRAGRRGRPALAVLVGLDTTINQYIMRHPEYLFGRPIEEGVVDRDNPHVVLNHLRCAAYELPLPEAEVARFGPHAPLALQVLAANHKLHHDRGLWYHGAPEVPHHEFSLRDMTDRNVTILDRQTGQAIGELPKLDAPPIVHPEAIYLHQGETYLVESLDLHRSLCHVRKVDVDYYTQPLGGTDVHHVDHRLREKPFGTGTLCFGEVTTHDHTWGYERIHFYTLDALSRHRVDLPILQMETMAVWIVPPEELCRAVYAEGLDAHGGLRGIGYATRMVLPLFVRCETLDFSHSIGAANAPWQAVFVYERYALGLGFTERAYEIAHRLLPAVRDHIRRCDCAHGCPCCVGKPLRQATAWNVERGEGSVPSKHAALRILDGLLADGTHLDQPDTASLGQDQPEARLAIERSLRRRLEHHREPLLPQPVHPVRHGIPTAYPEPEDRQSLDEADVARRAIRRLRHGRAVRRGEAEPTEATPQPQVPSVIRRGASPDAALARRLLRRLKDAQPPHPPSPRKSGDPLAALARRRKRGRNAPPPSTPDEDPPSANP